MFIKSLIDVFSHFHHARIVRYIKKNNLNFEKYVDVGTHEGELLEYILKLGKKKFSALNHKHCYIKRLKKSLKKQKYLILH